MTTIHRAPKVGDDITVGVIPYRIVEILGSDQFDDEGQVWHLRAEHESARNGAVTSSLVLSEAGYGAKVWGYAR